MLQFLQVYRYQGTTYFAHVITIMYLWSLDKRNTEVWVETCWNYFVFKGGRGVGGNATKYSAIKEKMTWFYRVWIIYFAVLIQFDNIFQLHVQAHYKQVLPKGIPAKFPVLMDLC